MTSGPTERGAATGPMDFNAIAAVWSRSAETLAPLTPVLADRLGPLAAGTTLLDLACGTGEPGLDIVAANPGAHLLGVDTATAMVEQARTEAAKHPEVQARFEVMAMQALDLGDSRVDAVVSRMGLFGVPGSTDADARESFRVLRPGGRLAVAVWDGTIGNPLGRAAVEACRLVAGASAPDFGWQDELADGRRERWLHDAGFVHIVSEPVSWTIPLANVAALWAHASEIGPLRTAFAAVDESAREAAREHFVTAMAAWRATDGSYPVDVTGRVLHAATPQ